MKFLIVNTDYPDFLLWLYAQHPDLENRSYAEQVRLRYETLYGVADFYSSNLRVLGHEAEDVYANNEGFQRRWAAERGLHLGSDAGLRRAPAWFVDGAKRAIRRTAAGRTLSRVRSRFLRPHTLPRSLYAILKAQIQHCRPDVLLNQSVDGVSAQFIKEVKPYTRFIVGQHAATVLPDHEDYSGYDLMISSFPATVTWFQSRGLRAVSSRLAFEPRVLSYLKPGEKEFDVTFAGSLFAVHRSRRVLLEHVCQQCPQMKIWGPACESIAPASPLRGCYAGTAWGRDMYHILHASKITLNHHGDVAPYANNLRLFEATGVGTLLLTDWKQNLCELFDVGTEVVTYRSSEECAELVRYYLTHDKERDAIAEAGQKRTCRDHTYAHRMMEFTALVGRYV